MLTAKLPHRRAVPGWLTVAALLAVIPMSGCAIRGAVPASQLPSILRATPREAKQPIDLTMLGQPRPREHVVQPRDILGIFIEDVFGSRGQLPPINIIPPSRETLLREPTVGQPIEVMADGSIRLPMADPIYVAGLTIPQVYDRLHKVYVEQRKVLRSGKERIHVSLIRPRSERVVVIREDSIAQPPTLARDDTRILARSGSAQTLELPAYENDVLHALAESGGLPGLDGQDEVWVLRSQNIDETERAQALSLLQSGGSWESVCHCIDDASGLIRLPLRLHPQEPLCFQPEDVLLFDNDVVFVRPRDKEYFITGGLLSGAKIPLPRDHDVDVLEAVAIANGQVDGPISSTNNFNNGPGNIIPPSRVLIVRRWGRDQQIKIEVDIRRAIDDPRERVLIQPGDLVILKYTPAEICMNAGLNIINFSYSLNQR